MGWKKDTGYKEAKEAGDVAGMEEAQMQRLEEKAARRPSKKRMEKLATYSAYMDMKRAQEAKDDPALIEQRKRLAMEEAGAAGQAMGGEVAGAMLGAEGQQYQTAGAMQDLGGQVAEAGAQAGLSAEELQEQIMQARFQSGLQHVANARQAQQQNAATYFSTAGTTSAALGAAMEPQSR